MSKLQALRNFLTTQGYRPQLHDDFVGFRHEGGQYVIPVDDDDPNFFRIVFPNFWHFDTDEERGCVLEIAATITAVVKSVKVFPSSNDTIASVELVLPNTAAFIECFPRALFSLQVACHQFRTAMHAHASGESIKTAIRRLTERGSDASGSGTDAA